MIIDGVLKLCSLLLETIFLCLFAAPVCLADWTDALLAETIDFWYQLIQTSYAINRRLKSQLELSSKLVHWSNAKPKT